MDESLASPQAIAAYLRQVTHSPPSFTPNAVHRAAQRARWLAELAAALDHATKLTVELCDYCSEGKETGQLRGRIRELRDEVDLMQKGRYANAAEIRPNWT